MHQYLNPPTRKTRGWVGVSQGNDSGSWRDHQVHLPIQCTHPGCTHPGALLSTYYVPGTALTGGQDFCIVRFKGVLFVPLGKAQVKAPFSTYMVWNSIGRLIPFNKEISYRWMKFFIIISSDSLSIITCPFQFTQCFISEQFDFIF